MFINNIFTIVQQLYINMTITTLAICAVGFVIQKMRGFEKLACLCNGIAKHVVVFCITLLPAMYYYSTMEFAFKNDAFAVVTIVALLYCFRGILRCTLFIISMWLTYARLERYVLEHLHEIDKYNFTEMVNELIRSEMKGVMPEYVDLFLCDTQKLATRYALSYEGGESH